MSMFIKGENPPKSCYVCGWYNRLQCPVNDGRYYYRVQRHPSCPLTEIKEPHGRLGDLDALIEKYGEWYTEEGTESGYIGTMKNLLKDAPTVIEAEAEEKICNY